jgi:hypothetical protein
MRAPGLLPEDPEAYSIYGRRVMAPCSGSVVSAVDGAPDMPVPLHIHAQRPGPPGVPMGGDPLPMRLGGRYLVRGDRVVVGAGGG